MQVPVVIMTSQDFAIGLQLKMFAKIVARLYPTTKNAAIHTATWKVFPGNIRK